MPCVVGGERCSLIVLVQLKIVRESSIHIPACSVFVVAHLLPLRMRLQSRGVEHPPPPPGACSTLEYCGNNYRPKTTSTSVRSSSLLKSLRFRRRKSDTSAKKCVDLLGIKLSDPPKQEPWVAPLGRDSHV